MVTQLLGEPVEVLPGAKLDEFLLRVVETLNFERGLRGVVGRLKLEVLPA